MNAAIFRLGWICWIAAAAVFAATPTAKSPLTILMDFESARPESAMQSLQQNLNQLLGPAGISVNLRYKEDLPTNPQFGDVVIFKMKGSCTMVPTVPMPVGALSDERGPLAMAYSSDGQILHFGEVECDHLRRSLQRVLAPGEIQKNQVTFGSALALVMAHEVYHMLGNAKHTAGGLTKASLSAQELLSHKLELPSTAVAAIRKELREPNDVPKYRSSGNE